MMRHVSSKIRPTMPIQSLVAVALAAVMLPAMRLQAQASAPVDGPAGYEVACSLHAAAVYRACNELPSARSCESEPNFASRRPRSNLQA